MAEPEFADLASMLLISIFFQLNYHQVLCTYVHTHMPCRQKQYDLYKKKSVIETKE